MNYIFFSSVLLRTPFYSFRDYEGISYSRLLKDKDFQASVFLASKAFFDELAKKEFDFESLTEKQKQTVRKYFNRAAHRSTPFGQFSTFSLVQWADKPELKITLPSETTPFIKLDFSILVKLWEKFLKSEGITSMKFQPNQSLYYSDTDLRYIKTDVDSNDKAHFSMVAVAKNPILKKLLRFCVKGKSVEDLRLFLVEEAGTETKVAEEFIREILDQQIIVSMNAPHVTGPDFSDLFSDLLTKEYNATESCEMALSTPAKDWSGNVESLSEMATQSSKNFSLGDEKNYFYCISERSPASGGLPSKYQQQITEGLHCLNLLCTSYPIADLEKFKKAFIEKYESEAVPLLQVLDAQFGIGYGEFANIKHSYSFLTDSHINSEKKDPQEEKEGDLASLLLNEWHLKSECNQEYELEITDEHLKKIKTEDKDSKLPPSISVMFRIAGENIFIEHAGGCSALSLLGRFSLSEDVYEFGREIAKLEQSFNKDIVFAEIAHVCDLHSANINRRNHLREYEIPVLTNSIMEPDKQIELKDIMVSVVEDTVQLRSKKLRKIIIPRLSSAYNYTKNCFPVFRFLCDVQRQHLKTDFSISLSSLLPGLKFYPRIRYKSCILQAAEWHLAETDLKLFQHKEVHKSLQSFRAFAHSNNLPRYFAYCFSDNFLVFDQENADEVVLFLKEIEKKETVVLREFPFIEADHLVEDSFHRPLLAQYVASLYVAGGVYKESGTGIRKRRKQESGNEWLYFKLYCHPLSSDVILCEHIFSLIKKYSKEGSIKEWFWVRYQDPDYHIRLRIKPAANKRGSVFEIFNTFLNKLYSLKLVHHFHTDMYRQETNRYSVDLMPCIEAIFNSSSNKVIHFLKSSHALQWTDEVVLAEAVSSVCNMLQYVHFSLVQRVEFCKVQFARFFQEFGSPKNLKPEIEKLHKSLYADIRSRLIDKEINSFDRSLQQGIEHLLQNLSSKKIKEVTIEKLTADLIHMHLNRLFSSNQRYFEMVVYYLVYRSLTSQIHKAHLPGS